MWPSTGFGQRHRMPASSGKLLEQRLGVLQVGGVEALGEPAVDRREQVVGLGAPALVAPEPRQAGRGAQLPGLRLLMPGDVESALEGNAGLLNICMGLVQVQLASESICLGLVVALPAFLNCV